MIAPNSSITQLDDTIVALSSAPGPGHRAIIRLSGPAAIRIAAALMPDLEVDPLRSRQISSSNIKLPNVTSPLPADIFLFRAPNTYTGQDIVELHTLSCMPLIELAVAELLCAGARAAGPGEFTMRGFLAGKLDLTRAEAVHAVIEAAGPDQLKSALAQLAGGIARPLDTLRNDLLNLLADIEAGLDFTDEDLTFVEQPQLLARLAKALAQVTLVGKQIGDRGTSDSAFRVVLAGAPNAGKSSLFNALVGRDSALVSPIAGTTRDYLEATLVHDDVAIQLIDTAGLGDPQDAIDAAAQSLGRERQVTGDLILWCQPADQSTCSIPDANDPSRSNGPALMTIVTKADLGAKVKTELAVSVVAGTNLDRLKSLLADAARSHLAHGLAPSLTRCRHHVERSLDHLRRAHRLALDGDPAELLALELRLALDELGAIVGAVYTDDLLDRIFSRFCIGK